MQVICAEHHRAQQTLYKAWKRYGIEIRRYYRFHSISEEESRITAEKRNRGVPMRVICAEHHRTDATLHGAWKRDGIKIRRYNPGRINENEPPQNWYTKDGRGLMGLSRPCSVPGCPRPGMVVLDRRAGDWICYECNRQRIK